VGKIIFILGGAKSGKSSYAIKLAKETNKRIAFVATCLPLDREMKRRIKLHKKKRPSGWQTFEEPTDLLPLLKKISSKFDVIIVDCLTLFISNLLLENINDRTIKNKIDRMLKILKPARCKSIMVANEVGLGIVPQNRLARNFRDLAGSINQIVARKADEVFFMCAGIPIKIK
jgi:adenosylcobinamide kinase/adenosylcobinamide-phosphate guanylyltransferase